MKYSSYQNVIEVVSGESLATNMKDYQCDFCKLDFRQYECNFRRNKTSLVFCSRPCKGKYYSLILFRLPPSQKGKSHTEETKLKMRNRKPWNYIGDRTQLAKKQERNDSSYKEWRKQVWLRDNFKCKIANPDCCGRIEAHHILSWSEYPELRYQNNNGITLCHAHHPRKRAEEKRLVPTFQELVSVSSY